MEIRVFCYWCIRIGHLELTSHGPAETVYCSVSNKGVLRWESSFDLSGQSFRCHFGHNFSDGLVLLRDLRGRTGHRTWGRTWVWRPLAEWYMTRSKPSVLVPKVDSRLLDETIWTGKQTAWNAGNPQPRSGHQGWFLSRKVHFITCLPFPNPRGGHGGPGMETVRELHHRILFPLRCGLYAGHFWNWTWNRIL